MSAPRSTPRNASRILRMRTGRGISPGARARPSWSLGGAGGRGCAAGAAAAPAAAPTLPRWSSWLSPRVAIRGSGAGGRRGRAARGGRAGDGGRGGGRPPGRPGALFFARCRCAESFPCRQWPSGAARANQDRNYNCALARARAGEKGGCLSQPHGFSSPHPPHPHTSRSPPGAAQAPALFSAGPAAPRPRGPAAARWRALTRRPSGGPGRRGAPLSGGSGGSSPRGTSARTCGRPRRPARISRPTRSPPPRSAP